MDLPRHISAFKLLLVSLLANPICQAQVLTANDGFEGPPTQGTPPPGWYNCNDGLSTGDTQPGAFQNYVPASEGQSYLSLVTRALNPPGTVETVWANLLIPFEQDEHYSLTIDLSLSLDFQGDYNWETYYFNNPCKLRIIGFNGDCASPSESELLWESSILTNYDWQTFDVSFTPNDGTYQYIALRPYFISMNNFQNSSLLLDDLRYVNENGIEENSIRIPNVITPNGDGVNDVFYFGGTNIARVNAKVYNRWGELIFESNEDQYPWDGKNENIDCPEGVYFYIMDITFKDGEMTERHGDITLLR